jgi:hypothetical protein
MEQDHYLMRYFDTSRRTQNTNIRDVARKFEELVAFLNDFLPEGSEKSFAMRQVLLAKDAGCRSALDLPEG